MLTDTALSPNAHTVLAYLLADPHAEHRPAAIARSTDLTPAAVTSAVTLLIAHGWVASRDLGGTARGISLTEAGRTTGAEQLAQDATPLRQVDVEDPVLADRVRALMGWPLRHA